MHVAENWFAKWFDSPYYHKLYFERDEKEAAAFIDRLLAHLHPPPASRMLDVACGRGRHSRVLASKGFDVTGIDLSPNSIAYAKQYEQENLHFFEHDIRRPFWMNYFHYAFNLFTSFGYFRTRREHYGAMRTIAQSLQKKGYLILDYLNAAYVEPRLIAREDKVIDDVTFHITRTCDETHFYKNIIIDDKTLPAPLEFTEKITKFSVNDFREMFSYHHLQIQDIFGDHQLTGFDENNSPRMIFVAVLS